MRHSKIQLLAIVDQNPAIIFAFSTFPEKKSNGAPKIGGGTGCVEAETPSWKIDMWVVSCRDEGSFCKRTRGAKDPKAS